MVNDEQVQRLKKIAAEAQLLGDHPPQIRCRLCETLVARLAAACVPLMSLSDLRDLNAFISSEFRTRSSRHETETK